MRWFSAPWCTLPTELSGPGDRPAFTWARTRWFVQSRMRSSRVQAHELLADDGSRRPGPGRRASSTT